MVRVSQMINHEKRWAKLKANPKKYREYLDRQNEYQRLHPKDNRKYLKELREVARDVGNCPCCFKPKINDNPKYSYCDKCREYAREYYHNHKRGLNKK